MTIRGHKVSISTFTSKKAASAYGALAFFYTINGLPGGPSGLLQEYSAPTLSFASKLQGFFIGVPLWRLSGSRALIPSSWTSPFYGSISPNFNLSKANNKVFWLGLALTIYGAVGGHFGLPYSAPAMRVGVPVAVGAFIGGGFDADAPGATPTAGLGSVMSLPAMSAAPGAGMPAQGSFSDGVRA